MSIIITTYTGVVGEGIILSSNVSENVPLCPGQEVNFICESRGSPTITWSSNEYIDLGSRLQFAAANPVGDRRIGPIDPNTIATLVNVSRNSDGQDVLVSRLRIIVTEEYLTFSITCSLDNRTNDSVSLQLLGKFVSGKCGRGVRRRLHGKEESALQV